MRGEGAPGVAVSAPDPKAPAIRPGGLVAAKRDVRRSVRNRLACRHLRLLHGRPPAARIAWSPFGGEGIMHACTLSVRGRWTGFRSSGVPDFYFFARRRAGLVYRLLYGLLDFQTFILLWKSEDACRPVCRPPVGTFRLSDFQTFILLWGSLKMPSESPPDTAFRPLSDFPEQFKSLKV